VVALIEELGRTLAPVPLFSSALVGASVLTNFADTSLAARLLPGIVAGDIFALAHSPAQPLRIDHADQQSRISGAVTYVADGSISTWLLIGISDDEPGSLAVVRTDSPGVEITPITTIDGRAMADIVFQDSPIEAVLNGLANGNPLDWALDCARTGLAAEMLGAASEAFDITLDYLRTREQFGRAIGSFQAIQHRCALLSIELELTRSCVTKAADAIENDTTDRRRLVSLAKATAGELIRRMSYEMIQLHGGIGMTDEHDAGLYLKRGRVAGLLHGDASFHRDRYARLSGF
jgi:alkylation response protein AidB-like acyl-CoA dehydrogenase